jgi:hypothetical protein
LPPIYEQGERRVILSDSLLLAFASLGLASHRLREYDLNFPFACFFFVKHSNSAEGSKTLSHQLSYAILKVRNPPGCNHFIVSHL